MTLAALEAIGGDVLRASVQATFTVRASHDLPASLPFPPAPWAAPYARLARESPISTLADLQAGYALAVTFWQPFLDKAVAGRRWDPRERDWHVDT